MKRDPILAAIALLLTVAVTVSMGVWFIDKGGKESGTKSGEASQDAEKRRLANRVVEPEAEVKQLREAQTNQRERAGPPAGKGHRFDFPAAGQLVRAEYWAGDKDGSETWKSAPLTVAQDLVDVLTDNSRDFTIREAAQAYLDEISGPYEVPFRFVWADGTLVELRLSRDGRWIREISDFVPGEEEQFEVGPYRIREGDRTDLTDLRSRFLGNPPGLILQEKPLDLEAPK